MALKWEITRINKAPSEGSLSNVCKEIEWVVSEDDPEKTMKYEAYRLGVVTLKDADSDSFVEFDSLTHEVCTKWVKDLLGSSEVSAIEDDVNRQLVEQETGSVTTGVPW